MDKGYWWWLDWAIRSAFDTAQMWVASVVVNKSDKQGGEAVISSKVRS